MLPRMRARLRPLRVIPLLALVACGPGGGGGGGDPDADPVDAKDFSGDEDHDGISDFDEGRWDPEVPDHDNDGVPDWQDEDSDDDGWPDLDEGTGDDDGDGLDNHVDPTNDAGAPTIHLTAISTTFNSPIGIDYHEPTD